MATTKRSDLVYVDQLQEAISASFAGKLALYGTGAAVINTTLPAINADGSALKGGDTVRVPYFNAIGDLADVPEGSALTPVAVSQTSETSTVVHSGVAVEITSWAQLTAQFADPYAEAGKQFSEAWIRRIDKGLITKAATTSLSKDISGGVGAAAYFSWDAVCDAVVLWGDEFDLNDIALMVLHSKVANDMWKLKDSAGRPLMVEPQSGELPRFRGIPVKVSDRISVAAGVYTNLIVKKGALVAWVNGTPTPKEGEDILADTRMIALHTYHVEHLYSRPIGSARLASGATKPGVVKLITKAST